MRADEAPGSLPFGALSGLSPTQPPPKIRASLPDAPVPSFPSVKPPELDWQSH